MEDPPKVGITFNGVDRKLWDRVRVERVKRRLKKSQVIEEAFKLWLGE